MRPILLIANPISGRGAAARVVPEVQRGLEARGFAVDVHTTTGPGDATRAAREAPAGVAAVVAVGGDGTVTEVAEGLRGREIPLGIVPIGTANVLAREVGLPRKDVEALTAIIAAGRVRRLDAGELNGRLFLLVVGAGFDGEIAHRHKRGPDGSNSYSQYVGAFFGTLLTSPFPGMRIEVDGKVVATDAAHASVGNTRNYGGPFQVTSLARPDDGLLDVTWLEGRSLPRWLGFLVLAIGRKLHWAPGAHTARGKAIRIVPADPAVAVPVQRDGDPFGTTPVEARVIPQAVPVLVP
ncbi:MAG: diacylglycerol kinase family lipid kinase [Planctomycetales bacterium]|nr:diacylglycerol kinase family lipid kinase [Planctomycetales bacterium]